MDSQKLQAKQFEAQQKQRQHVQGFIDRFRYNANRAALVQSRIKVCTSQYLYHHISIFANLLCVEQALERMELLADVVDDPKFTFTFPPCEPLQKPIVLVNTLTFGYRPEKILLENIDLRVDIRSRIGIVGGNGVGKSTLIKLIMNQLTPLDGWVEVSGNARVTCFSQHHGIAFFVFSLIYL
jgi:ATP-binding cassette subfamily F protein 3